MKIALAAAIISVALGNAALAQKPPEAAKTFTAEESRDAELESLRARIAVLEQQLGAAHAEVEQLRQEQLAARICQAHGIPPDRCRVDPRNQTVTELPSTQKDKGVKQK